MRRSSFPLRVLLLQVSMLVVLAVISFARSAAAAQDGPNNCTNLPSNAENQSYCEIPQQSLCSAQAGSFCAFGAGGCFDGECSQCTNPWNPACW